MKWWENHLSACGTQFRGCAPECPVAQVEEYAKGYYRDGAEDMRERAVVVCAERELQHLTDADLAVEQKDSRIAVEEDARAWEATCCKSAIRALPTEDTDV